MALDTSIIKLAFQLILGREPAPNRIIALQQQFDNLADLRRMLMQSAEFERTYQTVKTERAPIPQAPGQLAKGLVAVHLHIPKTAGSSLNVKLLQQHPEDARVTAKDGSPEAKLRAMTPAQRGNVRIIAGHCVYGIHALLEQPALYVCLLRNPGHRLLSFYRYIFNTPEHPMHEWVKENAPTFGQFLIVSPQKKHLQCELDNGQLRRIAGNMVAPKVTQPLFEMAVFNLLAENMIFGLTEAFPEFLNKLVQRGLVANRHEPRANVSKDTTSFEDVIATLSNEEADLLDHYTKWDTRLYTIGQAWLGTQAQARV